MSKFRELTKEVSRDLSFRILSQVTVEHDAAFMPNAFQLFPERYLAPNRDNSVLCIDYDMGTGKSLSASLAVSRLLKDTAKIEEELKRSGNTDLIPRLPRPYVIGNWSSIEAFEDEFMRPIFGIITEEEYADFIVSRGLDEYEHLRNIYTKRIHHRVKMASYQKMFNRYFRNVTQLAMKDAKSLQAAIDRKDIIIDAAILMELSNSVLIVDELRDDARIRTEDRKARPCRRTFNTRAYAVVSSISLLCFSECHTNFIYSERRRTMLNLPPSYPASHVRLRLHSGCPCPCTAPAS